MGFYQQTFKKLKAFRAFSTDLFCLLTAHWLLMHVRRYGNFMKVYMKNLPPWTKSGIVVVFFIFPVKISSWFLYTVHVFSVLIWTGTVTTDNYFFIRARFTSLKKNTGCKPTRVKWEQKLTKGHNFETTWESRQRISLSYALVEQRTRVNKSPQEVLAF